MTEPSVTSALDQLEGLTSDQARQVVAYHRILVEGLLPPDTAADLAADLARALRRMAFRNRG